MGDSSVTYFGKNAEKIEDYRNPMHIAAIRGDVETMLTLKNSRVKINQEENGQTPLHLAVMKGNNLAARITSLVTDINKLNRDGYAPLHLAVLHNNVSLIGDLMNIDPESDVDIFDTNGNTALHIAVLMGNANAVRALLKEGADADLPNKEGNTPLHLAIIQGNPKVLDVLVKYVRKPNIFDKNKFRPLHLAVLLNRIDAIRKLGKLKGTNLNHLNGDGDTALHIATKLRNLEAIQALLDLKASVNLKNNSGYSPLHLALIYDKLSATEILARIDKANRFKNPPIHVSEAQDNVPGFKLLCRTNQKVNVNIIDQTGEPLLHSVIMADCEDAVKMLLDLKAKVNSINHSIACKGMTPLHAAVCVGNKNVIEMLLEYGANIHANDDDGNQPIHLAAKFCSSVGIEILIKHGVDITLKNGINLTPLDIIMLYVGEDVFGTAVQTLTDLFQKKNLKRKPLTSHEILKSAKLIIKLEIWENFQNSKLNYPEYYWNTIPIIKNYISECFAEIRLMKSSFLSENFDLHEFATKGWSIKCSLTRMHASEIALDYILDVSTTKGFPIYRDIILSNLERPALLNKVLYLKVPVMHNGKEIYLDLVAVHKYLGNDDILNLLLAYPDVNPDHEISESSLVKKRKLTES